MTKIAKIFLIVFLLFVVKAESQQIYGLPEIVNFYDPAEPITNEQIWQIEQASNGLLYFAANKYMLEYDGYKWRMLKEFGINALLSMDIDSCGTFYLGQKSSIASAKLSAEKLIYHKIDVNLQIVNVFKTFVLSDYVYFFTNKSDVIVFHNNNLQLLQRPSNFKILRGFNVDNKLFVVSKNGIGIIDGETLNIISYKAHRVYEGDIRAIVPFEENKYLIATLHRGLFLYDIAKDRFTKFKSEINTSDINFYYATKYDNSSFILTTLANGCYLVNKTGRVLFHFCQQNGLSADAVYYAYVDNLNNIWLGTSKGVSYVKMNSLVYYFDKRQKINDRIYSCDVFSHFLVTGSSNNLLYLDLRKNNSFSESSEVLQYGKPHCHIKLNGKEFLIYTGYYKMNVYDSSMQVIETLNTDEVYFLLTKPEDSSEFYVGSSDGLSLWKIIRNGINYKLKKQKQFDNINFPVNRIYIDKYSDIWLLSNKNIYCLDFNKKEKNYELREIENIQDKSMYEFIGIGKYIFLNSDTCMIYVENQPDKSTIGNFKNVDSSANFLQIKNIVPAAYLKAGSDYFFLTDSGIIEIDSNFNVIKKLGFTTSYEKKETNIVMYDNILFFNNRSYIFALNNNLHKDIYKSKSFVKLRSYTLDYKNEKYVYSNDSIAKINDSVVEIKYKIKKENKIIFDFYSVPIQLPNVKYYFRILNDGGDWIAIESNHLMFNHLTPGKYKVEVIAKDKNEDKFQPLVINFEVQKPFYETIVAFVLYFIFAVALFLFLLKIATRRVKRRRDILEIMVKERTEELEEQKEEIETQARLLKSQKSILEKETVRLKLAMIELQQLSTVAQKTDNAVLIIDKNKKFEWWNRGFADLFSYKIEKYKDLPLKIAHQKIRPDVYKEIRGYTSDKGTISYANHEIFENGQEIWYQTTINPVLDENGDVLKFVVIDKNISEIKNYETNIQNLNEINALLREKINKLESDLSIFVEQVEKLENFDKRNVQYATLLRKILIYNEDKLKKCLKEHFIIDMPQELLSGDFLWCDYTDDAIIIALGDSSGHRVHGTIVSALLVEQLKKIYFTNKDIPLDKLLFILNNRLFDIKQNFDEIREKDTFSVSILKIDLKTGIAYFSGSRIPLVYIYEHKLQKIDAETFLLGEKKNKYFDIHKIKVEKSTKFYMYSDGWPNLLGNLGIKKYTYKRISELLLKIEDKSMDDQKEIILNSIFNWKGNFEQMDDVLIFGFEI